MRIRAPRSLLLAAVLCISAAETALAQPVDGPLRWSVAVVDAESLLPAPRSYRLFATTNEIQLRLTLHNAANSPLLVDADQFKSAFRVEVSAEIPITSQVIWSRT